ncbi:hypothetical protein CHS0354_024142 [Potamilus streckersoni]|uniref:Mechanosensitive ion channel family protein n=1 Tax=Potamilus streckersoni TaxID=2493646 RepID=A0AAE0RZS7_9BIVA|nr:hypothetical protein CHS0354_024142 [Potamilus streckersoni]
MQIALVDVFPSDGHRIKLELEKECVSVESFESIQGEVGYLWSKFFTVLLLGDVKGTETTFRILRDSKFLKKSGMIIAMVSRDFVENEKITALELGADVCLESASSEFYFKLKTRRAWESATITPFAKRITIVVSVTVFLLYAMDQIGVNVASIALSLGVGSLAVALAAQETLSNIIAGFIIAIDKPFFVGDRIEILGKCKGDVTQIGLRSTHIRSIDNNVYIVPNLELVKNLILNSSFPTTTKRIVISVSIEYGYDIDFVRRVMLSVLDNEEDVTTENGIPSVHIIDFTDSGVLIKLFFYIKQVHREFDMEFYIREKVYKAFNKEKIVFSYPHLITHSNNPNQKSPQYLEKN